MSLTFSKGIVVILELRLDRRQKPERLRTTGDHKGSAITAIKWNEIGNRLYIGDDSGKVSVAKISSSMAKVSHVGLHWICSEVQSLAVGDGKFLSPLFQKSDIFKFPSEVIMRLESKIVQIDCNADQVLVSTLTKTYLCFTSKHQFKHIGTKLR